MKSLFLSIVLFLILSVTSVNAQSHNHRLTIGNISGQTIMKLYISPSSTRDWGIDRLGDTVLPTNDFRYIDILGHNYYDIKSVARDGSVCQIAKILLDKDKTFWLEPSRCYVEASPVTTDNY